ANVFLNYTNSYNIPANALPGVTDPRYTEIDASYTTDMSLIYEFGEDAGPASNVQVAFSVQNLFDEAPPLALNSNPTTGGIMFDPANASALQRVFQIQIGKRF
ncbi:MAG: hypothetical protein JNJ73_19070, partial [Hyphomonadaceae bacterium]|nr:hypothetical protein [Hyphomonadaceae bacterium]